jgi:hypothetical protein
MPEALKGDALIEAVKKLKGHPTEEICERTGYYTEKDGVKSHRQADFLRALNEAQLGFSIKPIARPGGNGREPSFHLKNGTTGTLPVNRAYTEMLGLEPGDMTDLTILEPGNVFKANGAPALVITRSEIATEKPRQAALKTVA